MLIEILVLLLDALLDILVIFSDYFSRLVHQADARCGFLSGSRQTRHLLASQLRVTDGSGLAAFVDREFIWCVLA